MSFFTHGAGFHITYLVYQLFPIRVHDDDDDGVDDDDDLCSFNQQTDELSSALRQRDFKVSTSSAALTTFVDGAASQQVAASSTNLCYFTFNSYSVVLLRTTIGLTVYRKNASIIRT